MESNRQLRGRVRYRLSRSFSRARWGEYRRLLEAARSHGYEIVSLEDWVLNGDAGERALILRHDVDQHPRSALPMATIERELGVRSTWYFRWRTAHPAVVGTLRAQGFHVGLHYETATRAILANGGLPDRDLRARFGEAAPVLRREIAAFEHRYGAIRSVCPHGDSRVPGINNGVLLRDADMSSFGIEFDGNEAMRGRKLGAWLTDRSGAEGGWRDGIDPHALLAAGVSPILCLTHPNNWASGLALWADRLLAALLPADRPARPIRTGRDVPPLDSQAGSHPTVDAGIDTTRSRA